MGQEVFKMILKIIKHFSCCLLRLRTARLCWYLVQPVNCVFLLRMRITRYSIPKFSEGEFFDSQLGVLTKFSTQETINNIIFCLQYYI